jgi:protein-L-isoaspartate(D-aspartate) O-methyltransferase
MPITEQKKTLIDKWRLEEIGDDLLKAFEKVPREEFVPEDVKAHAYTDQPLQIGHGQTISQPSTIMKMLKLLLVSSGDRVLEIGSGSGYVCALLAELGCDVVGIEIVPEISVSSAKAIKKLGYSEKIAMHSADASGGWDEGAPYDRILVSAAFSSTPSHLIDQLKNGGSLVAPVGTVEQRMLVFKKDNEGVVTEEDHGAYVFVPVVGKFGDEKHGDLPDLPFV